VQPHYSWHNKLAHTHTRKRKEGARKQFPVIAAILVNHIPHTHAHTHTLRRTLAHTYSSVSSKYALKY